MLIMYLHSTFGLSWYHYTQFVHIMPNDITCEKIADKMECDLETFEKKKTK